MNHCSVHPLYSPFCPQCIVLNRKPIEATKEIVVEVPVIEVSVEVPKEIPAPIEPELAPEEHKDI
jgi:hypothetical protein